MPELSPRSDALHPPVTAASGESANDQMSGSKERHHMSTVDQALLINVIVLFVVLEADIGPHRKIGWFRIARPLVLAAAIIPVYLKSLTTHGTGLYLELAGTAAGILLGLTATGLMKVYRSPKTRRPVSRAGLGYAMLWITVIGARSAFSYGSAHWFGPQLGTWMAAHHVVSGAITDTLLLMALGMLLTRTLGLAVRARALPSAGTRDRDHAAVSS
jgi:hypothetical protein